MEELSERNAMFRQVPLPAPWASGRSTEVYAYAELLRYPYRLNPRIKRLSASKGLMQQPRSGPRSIHVLHPICLGTQPLITKRYATYLARHFFLL
jgi:hypothetical protein